MATKNYENILETISSMTALELAGLVDAIQEKFGVSAAMPTMATTAASSAAEAPKEEKTQFKVSLTSVGDKKIEVIKTLRKVIPNLGLTEAKTMVENAPSVVSESATKADAEKIKKELEATGAKVELS